MLSIIKVIKLGWGGGGGGGGGGAEILGKLVTLMGTENDASQIIGASMCANGPPKIVHQRSLS